MPLEQPRGGLARGARAERAQRRRAYGHRRRAACMVRSSEMVRSSDIVLTLARAHGRTAASNWALSSTAARAECVVQAAAGRVRLSMSGGSAVAPPRRHFDL